MKSSTLSTIIVLIAFVISLPFIEDYLQDYAARELERALQGSCDGIDFETEISSDNMKFDFEGFEFIGTTTISHQNYELERSINGRSGLTGSDFELFIQEDDTDFIESVELFLSNKVGKMKDPEGSEYYEFEFKSGKQFLFVVDERKFKGQYNIFNVEKLNYSDQTSLEGMSCDDFYNMIYPNIKDYKGEIELIWTSKGRDFAMSGSFYFENDELMIFEGESYNKSSGEMREGTFPFRLSVN